MCARCDVFWERLCKRRGASSVEQRETMCKMRRIVQNVGFRAVKIHLFDVKHAQMFWAATHNRRAFGRICCRRSRLVGATYVVPSAPFSPRGDGWVYALPRYRRCNRSICARLCRVRNAAAALKAREARRGGWVVVRPGLRVFLSSVIVRAWMYVCDRARLGQTASAVMSSEARRGGIVECACA